MSSIDQAFIRAYATHDAPAGLPAVEEQHGASSGVRRRALESAETSPPSGAQIRVYAETESEATAEGDGRSQRRPLSSFAQPAPRVESRFKPSLEVDAFRWPTICTDLIEHFRSRLHPLIQTLLAADDAGRSLIGVAGAARGAGCTTLVACLARLLAEAGKSIAIVDGDFATSGLASKLGLTVEIGWEDVLAGRVPLAEAVVRSLGDSIALLPLVEGGAPAAEKLDTIHASVTAGVLRYHFDMVLFDLGAVDDQVQGPIARRVARQCRLDAVVLAMGSEPIVAAVPQRLMQTAPELATICLGVIENQRRAA